MVCVADGVDLFGAKPFMVSTPQSPPSVAPSGITAVVAAAAAGDDVFGMPVFSPVSPSSAFDQEMIDIRVRLMLCAYSLLNDGRLLS